MCAYDTTFYVGSEVIKPQVCEKAEAKQIYLEAKDEGRAALLAENLGNGLVEFKLGNVPAGIEVAVEVKLAFVAQSKGVRELFFKFPLDVATANGSVSCVARTLKGPFSFALKVDGSSVESVSTNAGGSYEGGVFRLDVLPSAVDALLVSVQLKGELGNSCLVSGRVGVVTLCAEGLAKEAGGEEVGHEFVFVVDCSGSMQGDRIARAGACLELFLRSLPAGGTLFNVVRFGSKYEQLFPASVEYTEENVGKALALAGGLKADLGGTQLLEPLSVVVGAEAKAGQRQVFVLTDGQVNNTDAVLALARANVARARCFALGIGSGADAGLVTGLALATGGTAAFVTDSEDPSAKVIGQLSESLAPSVYDINVESEVGALEIAPFPVPPAAVGRASTFFVRGSEALSGSVRVTGRTGAHPVEYAVATADAGGVGSALLPLFAFETLKLDSYVKEKAIGLSVESGILCRETAFVGVSQQVYVEPVVERIVGGRCRARCLCARAAPDLATPGYGGGGSGMMRGKGKAPPERGAGELEASRESIEAACDGIALLDGISAAVEPGAARVDSFAESTAVKCGPPASAGEAKKAFDMRGLLRLQSIEGKWSDAVGVAAAIGEAIPVRWAGTEDLKEEVFLTVIAVASLRQKAPGDEALWRMIAAKAIKWLSEQGLSDPEAVIAEAVGLLRGAL